MKREIASYMGPLRGRRDAQTNGHGAIGQ